MKKVVAFLVLALASLALVACGSSSDSSSSTTKPAGAKARPSRAAAASEESSRRRRLGSTLKFEADPNGELAYTTDQRRRPKPAK